MSTILKALQRLEDEKSANTARSLSEQVVARRLPRDAERRRMPVAAIAIAGCAVAAASAAALFWYLRREPAIEVAQEVAPAAAESAVAPEAAAEKPRPKAAKRAAPAARANAAEPPAHAKAAQPDSSAVEVSPIVEVVRHLDSPRSDSVASADLDELGDSAEAAAAPTSASAKATPGSERPARRQRARQPDSPPAGDSQTASVAARSSDEGAAPAPVVARASAPAPKAAPAPEPSTASVDVAAATPKSASARSAASAEVAAATPKSVPDVASAPAPAPAPVLDHKVVQRADLPSFNVEKTIWHPDSERRVAVVKLTKDEESMRLKEGDVVGPLVVKTITPGSVIFDHDGVEISYNVGG